MCRKRLAVPALTGLALLAVAAPAGAANPPDASTSSIRMQGGQNTTGPLCSTQTTFLKVDLGATARAVIKAPKTKKGRKARKGTKIFFERCSNGTWNRLSSVKLGARKKAKHVQIPASKAATGDYRIRIVTSKNKAKGKATYARVGVGEIMDVPVNFNVVNSNRTGIPCLNAPDNGIYQVKGTMVGPRAAIEGKGSSGKGADAALYYHGLGYGAYYWRFRGVPGYDYAGDQAYDNHVSIVVDRLGYGASKGPNDGNKICYSSGSDIADQIIGLMRSGNYEVQGGPAPHFARVALVGHSAGSLLALTTQGVFGSADALALTGYNSISPTPLAYAQLTAESVQCGAGGKAGPNGSIHYGTFGQSDAEFKAAHVYDMDPAVESKIVPGRQPDPCGDILTAVGNYASNMAYTRNINVPVLFLTGSNDALFTGSLTDVETSYLGQTFNQGKAQSVNLKGSGHALTLGRTHEAFRLEMSRWLQINGF